MTAIVRILAALAATLLVAASAVEFHVAPGGSDAGPGSAAQPFASLARAQQAVRALTAAGLADDVRVWIAGGTWRLGAPFHFDARDGGDDLHSVLWAAEPGATVVLSGALAVPPWQVGADGAWTATLPAGLDTRILVVGGGRAWRAAQPDQVDGPSYWHLAWSWLPDDLSAYQVGFDQGSIARWSNLADAELVTLGWWSANRFHLADVDPAGNSVSIAPPILSYAQDRFNRPAGGSLTNWWGRFENAPEFCDHPGEWYYDRGTGALRYLPLPGQDPAVAPGELAVLGRLLEVSGTATAPVRNLHFRELRWRHAGATFPTNLYGGQSGGCILPDGWAFLPRAIEWSWARGCSIVGGEIGWCAGSSLRLGAGCRDDLVSYVEVHDIGGNGVELGIEYDPGLGAAVLPMRVAALDCNVHDCGQQLAGSCGIWIGYSDGATARNDEVAHIPWSGISTGWQWDPTPSSMARALIQDDHVHDVMELLADGGGLYCLGNQNGGVMRGNLVHAVRRGPFANGSPNNGIFFDMGSSGWAVDGDVVFDAAGLLVRFFTSDASWQTFSDDVFGQPSDDQYAAALARTGPRPRAPFAAAIIAPADGLFLPQPGPLPVQVASDGYPGPAARIVLLVDGAVALTAPPWAALSWGATPGAHTLVARAIDPAGRAADSAPVRVTVNRPPQVTLTAPAAGAGFAVGAAIDLAATASDPDGPVARVDFLANGAVVASAVASPFTARWSGAAAGNWQLAARAIDASGATTTSATVAIRVGAVSSPYGGTARAVPGTVQSEDFDLGGEGVAYHDVDVANLGGAYRPREGVDIAANASAGGGFYVGWIGAGEWLQYTLRASQAGTYDVAIRYASPIAGRQLRLAIDGVDRGFLTLPATGGWTSWSAAVLHGIPLPARQFTLRLTSPTGGLDLDSLQVALVTPTAGG